MNLQLEQYQDIIDLKTKKPVRKDWVLIGYHGSSITSVLKQYSRVAVASDNKLDNINDVLDKQNEIIKYIDKAFKGIKLKVESDD